jgi:hypothetical protein
MRNIILTLTILLLLNSYVFPQKTINHNNIITKEKIIDLKLEYSKISSHELKIDFLDKIVNNLKKVSSEKTKQIITSIISDDFISKEEKLNINQINRLDSANLPVPKKLAAKNIYYKNKLNNEFKLIKSTVIYEDEDLHGDDFYFVNLSVSFYKNNNLLKYDFSVGRMGNEEGIIDFGKNSKGYYFYSTALGGTGSWYFEKLNGQIIKNLNTIRELRKMKEKYSPFIESYFE